ncbi:remorin family protein [Actinidia rufa]|uniref:Remorin family protein n=1 Tax=Actinidia rufa TaxID=165716 RepID=A0A7J0EK60_9ERIC|nr:remorin family protein [Actinidia rufa]
MPELGFEDQNLLRPGFRNRDVSPDSVIFTIFSSASGSVDRCSFASDVHDHDSFASEASQHLAGHDLRETSSGPDSDPKKSTVHRNSCLTRKVQKAKVHKEDIDAEIGDKNETLGSARNSLSQSLKECQDRRSRSEVVLKKPNRQRPASLDLNNHVTNATISSPRFGVMKKSSAMTRRTGTFLSPGTPNHRHASVGIQKGWSSERVPLHNNANRRHGSAALLPFNNGRTLPSKWEDAEKWIFSPVSADGAVKPPFQPQQRRPKSKSGPLGPPGIAYYSLHSPVLPMLEGGNVGNLDTVSPFSAGVIAADGFSIRSGVSSGGAGIFSTRIEPCMARSVSVHGFSGLLSQSLLPGPQDEKLNGDKDAATNISRAVSRRDMATQMSPEGSRHSSPRRRPSFSPSTPSILPIVKFESVQSSKLEVRDVQVDERVTMTRWSKKHRVRFPGKGSENVDNWKKKAIEVQSSAWEVSEAAKSISKMKREEAKISAWESLQRAKAESAIRKLEMKLEKSRSSSMDKIMNKLRSVQKKAQEMRSSVLTNQSRQVSKTSNKVISFHRTRQISSLSGCFTCHAY